MRCGKIYKEPDQLSHYLGMWDEVNGYWEMKKNTCKRIILS